MMRRRQGQAYAHSLGVGQDGCSGRRAENYEQRCSDLQGWRSYPHAILPSNNGLQGYVDDARNTDNAWLETVATHYHDEDGAAFHKLRFSTDNPQLKFVWVLSDVPMAVRSSQQKFIDLVHSCRAR